MLMIRLQRVGKTKRPTYRVVLSEKAKDPQSGTLEMLGTYNPTSQPKVIALKTERILYWMSKGAQPSATLNNLLIAQGLMTGKKQKSVAISRDRAKKLADKKAKAAEAPAA